MFSAPISVLDATALLNRFREKRVDVQENVSELTLLEMSHYRLPNLYVYINFSS